MIKSLFPLRFLRLQPKLDYQIVNLRGSCERDVPKGFARTCSIRWQMIYMNKTRTSTINYIYICDKVGNELRQQSIVASS